MLKYIFLLVAVLCGCGNDGLLSKVSVEEKYIYPSYGNIYVETDTAIIEVPIQDTAVDPIWVDSFDQPNATDGVDILWVIDPSGSMNSHKPRVLAGIEDMMNALPMINWRLAIISADHNRAANDSTFPLLPGDTVADAQAMYSSSVTGAYEAGFYALYNYIEYNNFSLNWMRDDAALLIVFVSDEEEQGTAQFPLVSDFTKWLDQQRESVFVASIVNHDPAVSDCNSNATFVGNRYMDATQHYNGQIIDICSNDWSAGVIDAANGAVPYSSYPLTEQPSDVDSIVVFVDGAVYDPAYWDYNSANNRIDFILVPSGGSLVEIAYYYVP